MKTKKMLRKLLTLTVIIVAVVSTLLFVGCNKPKFDETKNISIVAREDGSGTKSAFMEIVGLKGKKDVSGVIIGTGTAGVLAEVQGNPHAIAYESLGYVTDKVKTLSVDGVAPSVENIKNGSYKISRPLAIVYKEASIVEGSNKAFYSFLASKKAQQIIAENGYVSTKSDATAYTTIVGLTGEIKISGSTSLQPLMILLASEFEKIQPNVKITVSGGGSGTGYTNANNGVSDFGMISENFSPNKAPNCVNYEVAKDGIAIIVNTKNTFNNISHAQLKNIYNVDEPAETKITTWNKVTK